MPTLQTFRRDPRKVVNTFWLFDGCLYQAVVATRRRVTLVQRFSDGRTGLAAWTMHVPFQDLTSSWCMVRFLVDEDAVVEIKPRALIRHTGRIWIVDHPSQRGLRVEAYELYLHRVFATMTEERIRNFAVNGTTATHCPEPVEGEVLITWDFLPFIHPATHFDAICEQKRVVDAYFASTQEREEVEPEEPEVVEEAGVGPSVWEQIKEDDDDDDGPLPLPPER